MELLHVSLLVGCELVKGAGKVASGCIVAGKVANGCNVAGKVASKMAVR